MQKKHFFLLISLFSFLLIVYYSVIFFTNQNNIADTSLNSENIIADISTVQPANVEAVKYSYQYFTLDSNNNFNPKKPLLRVDALRMFNMIAEQKISSYKNISGDVPYFKDFNANDVNADKIRRLCSYIDSKKDFPKHYEILGYELNKDKPITNLEFMLISSSMLKSQKNGKIFNDVPTQYSSYISSLAAYGIINENSKINANDPITRENAATIIYKLSKYMN